HLDLGAILQPRIEMHEGAVEEGIAFAEHDDIGFARKLGETVGPFVVKAREQARIFFAANGKLGRDRIFHRVFAYIRREHALDDGPRLTGPPLLAEVSNMARCTHFAVGAYAHQIGIAGSKPATDDAAHR